MSGGRQTVLVVDDEPKILEVVKSFLEVDGYRAVAAKTGETALRLLASTKPDLVILDIMLPDIDGRDLCKTIRKKTKIPIIMLTARVDEGATLQCLDCGADDYVTKPFSPRTLIGRVRAVLRRYAGGDQLVAECLSFGAGELEINCVNHEVQINKTPVNLTPVEFKILQALAKNPRRVFTRDDLILLVYGYDYEGNDRSIDTHVKNLRQKIEQDSRNPRYIQTIHGIGYRFGGD